jgi:hypothetical protein
MGVRSSSETRDFTSRLGRWLRCRVGARVSRLGEVIGSHALTYNRLHFNSFHEHGMANAPLVIPAILQVFPSATKLLDIGAGSGAFAAEVVRRGRTVVALEHSAAGRRLGSRMGVDIRPFDLNLSDPADVPCGFDIAYCFEVAEHLPPQLGDRLVGFAASKAPVVVFTAAPPGQTGTGHINEQPKSYWIQRFERFGMLLREDLSRTLSERFELNGAAGWFSRNVLVFDRTRCRAGLGDGESPSCR